MGRAGIVGVFTFTAFAQAAITELQWARQTGGVSGFFKMGNAARIMRSIWPFVDGVGKDDTSVPVRS